MSRSKNNLEVEIEKNELVSNGVKVYIVRVPVEGEKRKVCFTFLDLQQAKDLKKLLKEVICVEMPPVFEFSMTNLAQFEGRESD